MRILLKLPCRERPQKLLKRIEEYKALANDKDILYVVNLDNNDQTMNPFLVGRLQALGCQIYWGDSMNKIHAVNRDMERITDEWDILVLASDDMVCVQQGWDSILKSEMVLHFPDTDGVLFHWDGDPATKKHSNGTGLNTMCIIGRKYFKRFSFIYHPDYKSLFCDNEFTEVADLLKKQHRSDTVLFKHEHYTNTPGHQPDNLMRRTQSFYTQDEMTYNKRKAMNFGL